MSLDSRLRWTVAGLLTDVLDQLVHVPELSNLRVRNIDTGSLINPHKHAVEVERVDFHLLSNGS